MNNIREALLCLWSSKQRTLLALLGITIGIASVIAMVTVGAMVEREAMKQFESLGTDFVQVLVTPDFTTGKRVVIRPDMGERLRRECDLVREAAPVAMGGVGASFQTTQLDVSVAGVDADFLSVNRLKIAEGRMVSAVDGNSLFCVVGAGVAGELRELGVDPLIGTPLKLGHRVFTVVGVLESKLPGGMAAIEPDKAILLPMGAALRQSADAAISQILARVDLAQGGEAAKIEIESFLGSVLEGADVRVTTAEALIEQMEKQSRMFTLMMAAIGSISLIVGGVGVMNVMLVSVSERRSEIGLRRAIGATQTTVQLQFLVESVVLCLLGGMLGVGFGIGSAAIVANMSGWEFFLPPSAVVIGVAVSSGTGVFFGFYPAKQASRLDIIACLRGA